MKGGTPEGCRVGIVEKYKAIWATQPTVRKAASKTSGKTPKKLSTTIGTPVKPSLAARDKKPAAKRAIRPPKGTTKKKKTPEKA